MTTRRKYVFCHKISSRSGFDYRRCQTRNPFHTSQMYIHFLAFCIDHNCFFESNSVVNEFVLIDEVVVCLVRSLLLLVCTVHVISVAHRRAVDVQ